MDRRAFIGAAAASGSLIALGDTTSAQSPADADEQVIDPDLPIIDPHHHFWDNPSDSKKPARPLHYLLPELLANVNSSGHNVLATMFVECNTMYRATGPEELRSLGETEFAGGVAAMSASGIYGPIRVAAGIVGHVDLNISDRAKDVLTAHVQVGGGRLRGIRDGFAWVDFPLYGLPPDPRKKSLVMREEFRRGFTALEGLNLSYDGWCFHTQIPEFTDLARAFPHTTLILDHTGSPLQIGPYMGKHDEVFAAWKANMRELAKCPNVSVKVGGLGMQFLNAPFFKREPRAGSEEIAPLWKPFVETSIEIFGANRCMFESNFPPDGASSSYRTIWNVFKILSAGYSADEKAALFRGTAQRVYRLDLS
jgi:L-fuconolactonase